MNLSDCVNEDRLKFYEENYKLVVSFSQIKKNRKTTMLFDMYKKSLGNHDYYIKDDGERTCRFCGKKEPEVTFINRPHAVSEFLGNKLLLSFNECDNCNKSFANIESDFANFLTPYLSMLAISGKKGVPKYVTRNEAGRIHFENNGKIHLIQTADEELFKINDDNSLEIKMEHSYVPLNVYKMLCKFTISTMPQSIYQNFSKLVDWICKPKLRPYLKQCGMFLGVINSPKIDTIFEIKGYERKDDTLEVPYYVLTILTNHLYLCCFVVSEEKDKHLFKKSLRLFPSPTFQDNIMNMEYIDLSSINKKTENCNFIAKGEEVEKSIGTPSDSAKEIYKKMKTPKKK